MCAKTMVFGGLLMAGMLLTACMTPGEQAAFGDPNRSFLVTTAQDNQAEIDASQIAVERATNLRVKDFARQMIKDHTSAGQQVSQLAQNKEISLPDQPDEQHRMMAAKLSKLSGADFDKQYIGMMVADHSKLLASLENQARQSSDDDVKNLCNQLIPTVREHLQMARDINQSLGGAQ